MMATDYADGGESLNRPSPTRRGSTISNPFPKIGLAFSGGGIRSASFCSGVLRKLIADGAHISQISSVSGGGYIGSSYMEWLAHGRHRGSGTDSHGCRSPMSNREIATDYFKHLEQNFAIYCDWHNNFPMKGLWDTVVFLATALLSFVILPSVMFLACAVPSAIRVETFFGAWMRDAFACPEGQPQTSCISIYWQSPVVLGSMASMICGAFLLRHAPSFEKRSVMLYVFGMWLAAEMLLLGGLVFLPCLFEVARRATYQSDQPHLLFDANSTMQAALILLYALLWVVIPQSPFHRRFGHVVLSLAAARLVQWRVFSMSADLESETAKIFDMATVIVGVLVIFMPILGPLKFSLPFLYNRARLQKLLHPDGSQNDWRGLCPPIVPSKPECRTGKQPITTQPRRSPQPNGNENCPYKVVSAANAKQASSHGKHKNKTAAKSCGGVGSARSMVRMQSIDEGQEFKGYHLRKRDKKQSDVGGGVEDVDGVVSVTAGGEDEPDFGLYAGHVHMDAGCMTLGDIGRACSEIEFMSQVVANHWRYEKDSRYEDNCKLVVLSSRTPPQVLHQPAEGGQQGMRLKPDDICLADAMAMSGAAVSINNGFYSSSFASIRGLQIFLGLSIGHAVMNPAVTLGRGGASNLHLWLNLLPVVCWQALLGTCYLLLGFSIGGYLPCVFEFILSATVILLALIPIGAEVEETEDIDSVDVKKAALFVKENMLRLGRWITMHVHLAFIVREILDIHTTSHVAPPIFFMSDGGHIENLGLLPLLYRRCKKIVVVDGGLYPDKYEVAQDVIAAMRMARAWLNCSFTSIDGKDVLYDIHDKLIQPIRKEGQPHCYRFRVHYHADPSDVERGYKKEEVGEILLLQPRHPDNLARCSQPRCVGVLPGDDDFESSCRWNGQAADDLTGCCCSCCHGHPFLHGLFGKFPFTSTFAQGFTPEMFHAYQNEGERAASAQEAHEFWTDHKDCDCIQH